MKVADMRTKTIKQLDAHTDKLQQQIAEKTRDKFTTEQKNVHEVREIRKELAQILTVRKELHASAAKDTKEETK